MNIVNSSSIKVAIIEENRFIRDGYELVLDSEPDFELVGSYSSFEEAFYNQEINKAEIVLIDIRLSGISEINGIDYIKKKFPKMLIIVCTPFEDDENIFETIVKGAVGFVSKKTPSKKLVSILRTVSKGGSPMSPKLAHKIIFYFQKKTSDNKINDLILSQVEQNILDKISLGKSYATVAKELYVNEEEILSQIRSIYRKFQEF